MNNIIYALQAGSVPLFPEQGSTIAPRVDALYIFLVLLTIFFFVLITGVLTYFVMKYRRRSPDEIPRPVAGGHTLELIWTVIPFIIGMGIFVWGASVYFAQYRPPENAMEIFVVGKQWMWKMQHPMGQREINELHVPVGRRVKLTMTTEDVIHSFFVPAFRMKMDVVPGRYTSTWFEATQPGRYYLFCAEYCGTNHSGMIGWINVLSESDYQAWLSGNLGDRSPVAAGEELFTNLGCATCHRADGAGGRGPALQGLLGSTVDLQNGSTVTADETYIRESILNPTARIVRGYPAIMPTFQGQLNEDQLIQLVAYIRTLTPDGGAGARTPPGTTTVTGGTSPAARSGEASGGAAGTNTTPPITGATPVGADNNRPRGNANGNRR